MDRSAISALVFQIKYCILLYIFVRGHRDTEQHLPVSATALDSIFTPWNVLYIFKFTFDVKKKERVPFLITFLV